MGIAYTAMLTAFYVDNGPHLPLWDRLPTLAFWLLPTAIAAPHHHPRDHPRQRQTAPLRPGGAPAAAPGRRGACRPAARTESRRDLTGS